jgi:heme-degrading monooxygenase HmoA
LLTDPSTDKVISITLWETEADMKADETSPYYREMLAAFAQTFAATPARASYQVSAQV